MSGLSRSDKKIIKLGSTVRSRREVTEEEAEELPDVETAASRSEVGRCIANINSLNHALGNLNCSVCEDTGCVQFTEEPKKKHGFSLSLHLQCTACYSVFSDNFMSPHAGAEHVHHPFKVNDRFVLFFGERLVCAALNKFCAMFGIKPMNKAVYQKNRTGSLM